MYRIYSSFKKKINARKKLRDNHEQNIDPSAFQTEKKTHSFARGFMGAKYNSSIIGLIYEYFPSVVC